MARPDKMEVTFVSKDGGLKIRFTHNNFNGVCEGAKALKASFFVLQDTWDHAHDTPVWAVYAMAKAVKEPGLGWVLPLPERYFHTATTDAPVMWALAKMSGVM